MLGTVLAKLRLERKLQQGELAKKAGVSQAMISRIENNPDYTPSWTAVKALANALGVNLDELQALERKAARTAK